MIRAIQVSLLYPAEQFVGVSDLRRSCRDKGRWRGIGTRIVNEVCFHGLQYAQRFPRADTSGPRKMTSGRRERDS